MPTHPAASLPVPPSAASRAPDNMKGIALITLGFVFFGATDGPGDVVVTVMGPPQPIVVRRKDGVVGS